MCDQCFTYLEGIDKERNCKLYSKFYSKQMDKQAVDKVTWLAESNWPVRGEVDLCTLQERTCEAS